MRKKIYIEFVGISGSGKSTLANKLESALKSDNYNVLKIPYYPDKLHGSSIIFKLTILIHYYLKNIKSFKGVLQTYLSDNYNYTGSLYTLLRRKFAVESSFDLNSEILINEEGTFQLYRGRGDRFRNTILDDKYHSIFYCQNFDYLSVIVFLNINTELAVLRCNKSRTSKDDPKNWSLHQFSKEEQLSYLNKWRKKNTQILCQIMNRYEDIIVIECDSTSNIDLTIKRIKEQIFSTI